MGRLTPVLVLAIAGFGVAAPGCGGGDEAEVSPGELERAIVALPEGVSIEAARDRLGDPVSEIRDEEGFDDLRYGRAAALWTLRFHDGRLESRDRLVVSQSPTNLAGIDLDRKIRSLHRGMSIADVESVLGEPRERDVEVGGNEVVSLWYDNWGLRFIDGRLDVRTSY